MSLELVLIICILALAWIPATEAFVSRSRVAPLRALGLTQTALRLAAGPGAPQLDEKTKERIDSLVSQHKVLLFMKGNKLFPQWCDQFQLDFLLDSFRYLVYSSTRMFVFRSLL
jgi:alpha-ketoglutarate-dependent taurine dioxygenase